MLKFRGADGKLPSEKNINIPEFLETCMKTKSVIFASTKAID